MLKAQDVVLLLKILSRLKEKVEPSQSQLAVHLCMSASEVNAGIKRLGESHLLIHVQRSQTLPIQAGSFQKKYFPVLKACEEFLISGVKYVFPAPLGEYTRGIPTSYASPIFENRIALGRDPIPVWPHAEGMSRGLALEPLYPSVPDSLLQYPDQLFYDFLALLDAIRQGRARERNIAIKLLKEKLHGNQ